MTTQTPIDADELSRQMIDAFDAGTRERYRLADLASNASAGDKNASHELLDREVTAVRTARQLAQSFNPGTVSTSGDATDLITMAHITATWQGVSPLVDHAAREVDHKTTLHNADTPTQTLPTLTSTDDASYKRMDGRTDSSKFEAATTKLHEFHLATVQDAATTQRPSSVPPIPAGHAADFPLSAQSAVNHQPSSTTTPERRTQPPAESRSTSLGR